MGTPHQSTIADTVRNELFEQLRQNYIWHLIGSLATVVSLAVLLGPAVDGTREWFWLAASILVLVVMGVSFGRLRTLPEKDDLDAALLTTAATGAMIGAFPWIDTDVVSDRECAFLVCLCVVAFATGSLVNLSPLSRLIRASLVPSLGLLAAALFAGGQAPVGIAAVAFLMIVATRPISNAQDNMIALIRVREDALRQASIDPLTGLLNRRGFFDLDVGAGSLIMLDLDGFKQVNDSLGHAVGDRTLIEVSEHIEQCTADRAAVAARLGGDEFAIVLPGSSADAIALALQLVTRLDLVINARVPISATAGVTELPAGASLETALKRSDNALYEGKRLGGHQVIWSGIAIGDINIAATPPTQGHKTTHSL